MDQLGYASVKLREEASVQASYGGGSSPGQAAPVNVQLCVGVCLYTYL